MLIKKDGRIVKSTFPSQAITKRSIHKDLIVHFKNHVDPELGDDLELYIGCEKIGSIRTGSGIYNNIVLNDKEKLNIVSFLSSSCPF